MQIISLNVQNVYLYIDYQAVINSDSNLYEYLQKKVRLFTVIIVIAWNYKVCGSILTAISTLIFTCSYLHYIYSVFFNTVFFC